MSVHSRSRHAQKMSHCLAPYLLGVRAPGSERALSYGVESSFRMSLPTSKSSKAFAKVDTGTYLYGVSRAQYCCGSK